MKLTTIAQLNAILIMNKRLNKCGLTFGELSASELNLLYKSSLNEVISKVHNR